jgi:hypothetical protein
MHCKHCNRAIFVAHICPYCKEYYCVEHQNPEKHGCLSAVIAYKPEKVEVKTPPFLGFKVNKNLFVTTLITVIFEDVLRQISRLRNPPFLEPNIYVAILSQWLTPYLASPLIIIGVCLILFATKKFSMQGDASNGYVKFLKLAVPALVYLAILITFVFSIWGWVNILSS